MHWRLKRSVHTLTSYTKAKDPERYLNTARYLPAQQVSQHTGTQPLVLLQTLPWHQTQANKNSGLPAGPFLPAEQAYT
jgi:hypothetical protein